MESCLTYLTSSQLLFSHRCLTTLNIDTDEQLELFRVSQEDVEFLKSGVRESTKNSYKYKNSEWDKFKQKYGYEKTLGLEDLPLNTQRIVLVKFIRHLHESHVSTSVIGSTVASLQFLMKVHCQSVKVFSDPTIQLARKATLPSQRSESLRKEQSRRYPVTLDMLIWLRKDYFVNGDIDDKMTYLGCILAFTFIWRISQYVSDNSVDEHAVLAEDVRFKLVTGEIKRPWELKSVTKSRVESVVFVIRSNKQRGNETQYLYLGRKSTQEVQLLEDLIEWCHISGVKEGQPFMSRYATKNTRVTHKRLTRKMVSTALKVVASSFGFDAVHFTPHGLRIGAATSAKAKAGRQLVQETAGWSKESNNDLRYELGTPMDDNALSISRTHFSVLTADQVKSMMEVQSQPSSTRGQRRSASGVRPRGREHGAR